MRNRPLRDQAPDAHVSPQFLPLGELVHRHVVGFALLKAGNGFPGYYRENNADTDSELPLLALHRRGTYPEPRLWLLQC